jgi:hypothetical protein
MLVPSAIGSVKTDFVACTSALRGCRSLQRKINLCHDLGYFDAEPCRLEPIDNPFGPKVLPMSPE